jgi:hypothetical protein
MHIYVSLLVLVRLRFALWLDCDLFPRFEESTVKLYEIEDPEHLFGEGKCPLTYYVSFIL